MSAAIRDIPLPPVVPDPVPETTRPEEVAPSGQIGPYGETTPPGKVPPPGEEASGEIAPSGQSTPSGQAAPPGRSMSSGEPSAGSVGAASPVRDLAPPTALRTESAAGVLLAARRPADRDTDAGFGEPGPLGGTVRAVGPHFLVAPAEGAPEDLVDALTALPEVPRTVLVLAAAPDAPAVLRSCLADLVRTAGERGARAVVLAASGLAAPAAGRRAAQDVAELTGTPVIAPDGAVCVQPDGALWVYDEAADDEGSWWHCPPHEQPEHLGPVWPPAHLDPQGSKGALPSPCELPPEAAAPQAPPPHATAPEPSPAEVAAPGSSPAGASPSQAGSKPDMSPKLREPSPDDGPRPGPSSGVPAEDPDDAPSLVQDRSSAAVTGAAEPRPAGTPRPVRTESDTATAAGPSGTATSGTTTPRTATPSTTTLGNPGTATARTAVRASTRDDRAALRALAGEHFQRYASRVDQAIARLPGLRAVLGDAPDADHAAHPAHAERAGLPDLATDLVAVLLYLSDRDEPFSRAALAAAARRGDDGPAGAFLACLGSGLRRLPSHRGPVLLAGGAAEQVPGTVLTEPAAIGALPCLDVEFDAPVEVVIWSATGRRTASFGDEPEVVFPPGSRFSVLETGGSRVLLREMTEGEDTDGPHDRRARDRLRDWLERRDALPGERRRPAVRPGRFRVVPGVPLGEEEPCR